jgi:hypothetical protein
VGTYDEVVARFGEDRAPALREQVATALVNKGVTLGQLGRSEEAVGADDEVVARFGSDSNLAEATAVAREYRGELSERLSVRKDQGVQDLPRAIPRMRSFRRRTASDTWRSAVPQRSAGGR